MLRRIIFTILLLLPACPLAIAHDAWIEKRDGKLIVVYAEGTVEEPYEPRKVQEVKAYDVKGHVVPIEIVAQKESVVLAPNKEAAIVTTFFDNGFWTETPEGWKKISKREAAVKFSVKRAIRSKKYAKTLLIPCEVFSKPTGIFFEIVLEKDPFSLKTGQALPIQVLMDSKPFEGAVIRYVDKGHSSKDVLKTNKEGKANVVLEKPGLQLITAWHKAPVKDDPDADMLFLSTSLTFGIK